MDIAALSMNMSNASIQTSVQISLMKITMENSTIINNQMTEMIDNMAIDTNVGVNLDISV